MCSAEKQKRQHHILQRHVITTGRSVTPASGACDGSAPSTEPRTEPRAGPRAVHGSMFTTITCMVVNIDRSGPNTSDRWRWSSPISQLKGKLKFKLTPILLTVIGPCWTPRLEARSRRNQRSPVTHRLKLTAHSLVSTQHNHN
ncbi:hypothetical protein INR49_011916 [Caranx melampygus]|nr:hypothetical protein INR49_011916 [Caranx melampygus]